MSDKAEIGIGIASIIWGALLLVLKKPLSEAYREFWPNKFGESNKDRGWHRKELIVIAIFLLILGVAAVASGIG